MNFEDYLVELNMQGIELKAILRSNDVTTLSMWEQQVIEQKISFDDAFKEPTRGHYSSREVKIEAFKIDFLLTKIQERLKVIHKKREANEKSKKIAKLQADLRIAKQPSKEDFALKVLSTAIQSNMRDQNRRSSAEQRRDEIIEAKEQRFREIDALPAMKIEDMAPISERDNRINILIMEYMDKDPILTPADAYRLAEAQVYKEEDEQIEAEFRKATGYREPGTTTLETNTSTEEQQEEDFKRLSFLDEELPKVMKPFRHLLDVEITIPKEVQDKFNKEEKDRLEKLEHEALLAARGNPIQANEEGEEWEL